MQKPARWPAILLAAACLVVGLLAVAGWRLLQLESAMERDRQRERLENATSRVVRESERAMEQVEATGYLSLRWDERGWRRAGGAPLLWSPQPEAPGEAPREMFAKGEEGEFTRRQPGEAIREYRSVAASADAAVRAGALIRIARCERALGQREAALATYAQLAQLAGAWVGGAPAEFVALRERAALLGTGEARARLQAALEAGSDPVDRATFTFYAQGLAIDPHLIEWAEAAERLWRLAAETSRGGQLVTVNGRHFAATWQREGKRGTARLTDLQAAGRRLSETLRGAQLAWQWTEPGGVAIGGEPQFAGGVLKSARETGLPFDVRVSVPKEAHPGTRILGAALFGLGLAIVVTVYLAYRAVRRELQVAAMQSEFVAAVSHEFRTPITALTHLTEMLETGVTEERRPLYYKALARETQRLREMVENLLDFGRIEAGRYRYKPERIEVGAFVQQLAAEFREEPAAAAHVVNCAADGAEPWVMADREALRRAVWNLLDNAAKYAPAGTAIEVRAAGEGGTARISVEDRGPGIDPTEQQRIFQKFVRGRGAATEQVKGTGIGLAMVDAIARAHGGRVELESRPGEGSRFTIVLPAERRE